MPVRWRRSTDLAFLVLPAITAIAREPGPQETVSKTPDAARIVQPIEPQILAPAKLSPASRKILEAYYDSILCWGRIVATRTRPVPGFDDRQYLGLPKNIEDHVRPTAYAAMVLGFIAEFHPPGSTPGESDRAEMRRKCIELLRYLTASHRTGGETCLNGKPWGKQWQSAMWARATGMAGWLTWPHLDSQLRKALVRLVAYEADRFIQQPPKSRQRNDTGAEENAWNASITALASTMLSGHQRANAWDQASKRYLYNTFSVRRDRQNQRPGDDARPIREWVTTVNAHDDFTVENHGMVHVGYLKNAAGQLQENAIHWLLVQRPVPQACSHHLPEVFDVLLACMDWEGVPVYFAGNDWKLVHTQATDVIIYNLRNLLAGDARAAYLENVALRHLREQQRAEGGYYNVRRDLEYGGLCATRLITCCLAHAGIGKTTEPMAADAFEQQIQGVTHLARARAVLHRRPGKFASFTWAQKRMALALPRNGSRILWPHFASYLGYVNGEDPSYRRARLERVDVRTHSDGFSVSGTLLRCGEKLHHDFFFASPPGDYTVYIERLRPRRGFTLRRRETGVIGLEYAPGRNTSALHGAFGKRITRGYGGKSETHALESAWLNIEDRVGYVVISSDGRPNIMRHHDTNAGSGRVPKLQEWLSLVGEAPGSEPLGPRWTCIVTFLNQEARDTARASQGITFLTNGDQATCRVNSDELTITFPGQPDSNPESRR